MTPKWSECDFTSLSDSDFFFKDLNSGETIPIHPVPEMRITAMAPVPGALAMAMIGSFGLMVYMLKKRPNLSKFH